MACDYCASDPHQRLCPMTAIEANPARKQAFDLGVPVATSDWIDAWSQAGAIQIDGPEYASLIELFSLHHNYVARVTEAKVRAALEPVHG